LFALTKRKIVKARYYSRYDKKLQEITHYRNYPEMMPFIGKFYPGSKTKILIIGESHFLNGGQLMKDAQIFKEKSWYDLEANLLPKKEEPNGDNFIGAIFTREVIEDFIYRSTGKSYAIFRNLASVLKGHLPFWPDRYKTVFENIAYFNYFQRPSFKSGKSIKNNTRDDEVAFSVFISVIQVLKPNVIFFASQKAFKTYAAVLMKNPTEVVPPVHPFPHPGSSHWNTKSKEYQVNRDGIERTGKEKFDIYIGQYLSAQS
jgi:hypothetical protein